MSLRRENQVQKMLKQWRELKMTDADASERFKKLNNVLDVFREMFQEAELLPPRGRWQLTLEISDKIPFTRGVRADCSLDTGMSICSEGPDELLSMAKLLQEGWNSGKRRPKGRACCLLAERRSCVCEESWSCPVHGNQCHGTHD